MIDGSMRNQGFTLIELISIILLVGVISVVATAKWPGGMKEVAAAKEFKRALRYAQHQAMTRQYVVANAWGLQLLGATQYSIIRQDGLASVPDFTNRSLLNDNTITITVNPLAVTTLWFNGLGEPIDAVGTPLAAETHYTVAGSEDLTVCPQTGYVVEGNACP
ncbi:MAG: hypothetical protein KKD73_07190 [Proteobacteria bacterium]|nr:hypothetical protein [Pseudomonadota bacterium]MBU1640224.1 hypothetical protein [Pseudomonadota bacterium]